MIRFAEAVLPGHPDKFCDQVADAIVAEAHGADPEAFAQIEVSVWSDQVWMSGNIVTRKPIALQPREILIKTGLEIGLNEKNWIDVRKYQVTDTICQNIDDPTESRKICDDQSIVVGYAGYDRKVRYLPPEQFLVHAFREALWDGCRSGPLQFCGPDGKLLVSLREEGDEWHLEKVLVTLQHPARFQLLDLAAGAQKALKCCYDKLQANDPRWRSAWENVAVMVNPNGPLVKGGSDGDNGQTGRKLVMDFYGPRIPIGGGALSGKHAAHIDRMAAYAARQASVHAVTTGAKECILRLAYAPNTNEPLEIVWDLTGNGERLSNKLFNFDALLDHLEAPQTGITPSYSLPCSHMP